MGRAGYASTDLHRQVSGAAPVTPLSSCLPAPGSSRQWDSLSNLKRNSWAAGSGLSRGTGELATTPPSSGQRAQAETDHSLCFNQWQWAMFCLIPFLKARSVSRPFWETGSGCYGSSHHPFLNCGNRGNHGDKNSLSCWCTTPVTLANAPRKPRKDHENEQDWTIWLWVCTMAFCMRAGRALILSQSLFSAFCRSRAHGHRNWGSQIWQGEIGAATILGISLHALMTQSCRRLQLCMKNASLNKRNLKGKFCFYAAWPWLRVSVEEGGAARARRQDQLTLWEQGVWQPGRHNYEVSQCCYHFLGRGEQNKSQPSNAETLHWMWQCSTKAIAPCSNETHFQCAVLFCAQNTTWTNCFLFFGHLIITGSD